MSRDNYMSNGPVSTMPGRRWEHAQINPCENSGEEDGCAEGTKANWTIQGETDSFGCEYFYLCNCCEEKRQAELKKEDEPKNGFCTFHRGPGTDIRPRRDVLGEGSSGPVYDMCAECRAALQKDADEEAEYWRRQNGDDDDDERYY